MMNLLDVSSTGTETFSDFLARNDLAPEWKGDDSAVECDDVQSANWVWTWEK